MREAIIAHYYDTQTRLDVLALAQALLNQPIDASTELVSLSIQEVREDTDKKRIYVVATEKTSR